jgi:UDP-sugar transporter A1/2/3
MSVVCIVLLAAAGASLYWRELSEASKQLSSWGLQIGAFLVLVCVQSTALLLFRLCQSSGSYSFSKASSVALTEACKLGLALSLHGRHVLSTGAPALENLSPRIVAHYFGLALCYTANNQLTFYCFELMDAGSFALGKSLAPYLVALMLRFSGQRLNELQWVCIALQCILVAVTQYNSCQSGAVLTYKAYAYLALATAITAVSSVWNQKVVKGFDVPVNLQNAVLYVFGLLISLVSYMIIQEPNHTGGFFGGYNLLGLVLILFQAFHGLAVTLVYKYADAIIKNFANSAVMAILVVISAHFLGAPTTLHSWLGVSGVLVTTYAYMNIALKMPSS